MIAAELISNLVIPLQTDDNIQTAKDRMVEYKFMQFPVLQNERFCGLIRQEQTHQLGDTRLIEIEKELLQVFVLNNTHVYEIIMLMGRLQLTLLPVLDSMQQYLGLITIQDITIAISKIFALSNPGGIIVLEISNRNNSLVHMAQIVEADNAQILSSYVQDFPDSTRLEVTLKINKTELSGIVASFERYDYLVKAVYNSTVADNGTEERYNLLMNYLNV